MAKKRQPEPEPETPVESGVLDGETIEEWILRKNREEGLDADGNEPDAGKRKFGSWDDLADYDPHMGAL